jgi:type II secretion system protein H
MRSNALRVPSVGEAGFTLIELMVVVMIVSILAVLAVPSMSHESWDRRAYTDAASVAELVREARTRAVGRGAAELLLMQGEQTGNTASFVLWEATTAPFEDGGSAGTSTTCNAPTVWPNNGTVTATQVDEFQINGGDSLEGINNGNINMQLFPPNGGVRERSVSTIYLCFTPAGRSYFSTTGASGSFVPISGTPGAIIVQVGASPPGQASTLPGTYLGTSVTNVVRNVWIPPSGSTTITTQ